MNSKSFFSSILVLNAANQVDVAKTKAKVLAELDTFLASHSANDENIAKAVNSVFDKNRGAKLNKSALTQLAIVELIDLGVVTTESNSSATMKQLSDSVSAYLKANTGDDESGALFFSSKGKGGGTGRRSDRPAKVEAATVPSATSSALVVDEPESTEVEDNDSTDDSDDTTV